MILRHTPTNIERLLYDSVAIRIFPIYASRIGLKFAVSNLFFSLRDVKIYMYIEHRDQIVSLMRKQIISYDYNIYRLNGSILRHIRSV